MKLVTVAEMKKIEDEANAKGYSYDLMMETAGKGVGKKIDQYPADFPTKTALALVGSGNNGGDALVSLAFLAEHGWIVSGYLAKERKHDVLVQRVIECGGKILSVNEDQDLSKLSALLDAADVLIDGLLGTGFKPPMKEPFLSILEKVNDHAVTYQVFAVDCPSGIDCDTGEADDACLKADVTICMQAIKIGLLSFPAYQYVGVLDVVDLGLPEDLHADKEIKREVATSECVRRLLPKRPLQAHKGTFGTAMIAAGSINYTGAALLAGKAAYRIGAGLVQMAVPGPLYSVLAGIFPEAIWLLLPHDLGVIKADGAEVIQKNINKISALLLGPGWGVEETTKEFLEKILTGSSSGQRKKSGIGFVMMDAEENVSRSVNLPPLVIDADGLKLLQKIENWDKKLPKNSVITPHPGEMSVLCGLQVQEIQNDRLQVSKKYAQIWNQILVLKGAMTIVSAPDGRQTVIPVAHPALARAGTGDVLAGIITGLLAQGIDAYDAAVAGVWIHAQAGLVASEKIGHPAAVMASDVMEGIPKVLERIG